MTIGQVKPDRIWSLSPEHEVALKQTWAVYLKSFGYDLDDISYAELEKGTGLVGSKTKNALPKISEQSALGEAPKYSERTSQVYDTNNGKADPLHAEYDTSAKSPAKEYYHVLAKTNPAHLHQGMWSSLKNDSPDQNILRFVRARKFHLNPTVEMLYHRIQWNLNSHPVDRWLLQGDLEIAKSKKHPELLKAFDMKKAYMRGVDRQGGDVVVIRVKKHFGSDCPEVDFERFICLFIETARLGLKDYQLGVDGANILFDMTGFSLKNADLAAVKFLAKSFEANYPETLNAIWIHKAPWIFNAVWKIIKGWLDPVVASKIHFTKTAADLEKFIDISNIPSDLGGKDDYTPKYIPPTDDNSAHLPPDEKYEQLAAERRDLLLTFIETTLAWIRAKDVAESTKLLDLKIQLGAELGLNYLKIDPYVRNRGAFERDGSLANFGI